MVRFCLSSGLDRLSERSGCKPKLPAFGRRPCNPMGLVIAPNPEPLVCEWNGNHQGLGTHPGPGQLAQDTAQDMGGPPVARIFRTINAGRQWSAIGLAPEHRDSIVFKVKARNTPLGLAKALAADPTDRLGACLAAADAAGRSKQLPGTSYKLSQKASKHAADYTEMCLKILSSVRSTRRVCGCRCSAEAQPLWPPIRCGKKPRAASLIG